MKTNIVGLFRGQGPSAICRQHLRADFSSHPSATHAADITWTIDRTQSSLAFTIPDFTVDETIHINGQDPSSGAPSALPWGPTTGNTAAIGGTFMSDIGGAGVER